MSDGTVMWVIGVVICIGVFLNGVRFARMTSNPLAGKTIFGMPVEGSHLPIRKLQLLGRIQMIFAPLFLIFWTLILLNDPWPG